MIAGETIVLGVLWFGMVIGFAGLWMLALDGLRRAGVLG